MPASPHSLAVELRMQRIAAGESVRRPHAEIVVSAADEAGTVWKELRWPVDELAYWVIT